MPAQFQEVTDPVRRNGEQSGRNLVVCCDGTGNIWKPGLDKTNIAKLFEALEKSKGQITYYDPGVGTPDGALAGDEGGGIPYRDTLRRLGGLAWGDGVWTNVAETYTFLLRNYQHGDRIFLFGFSRGAFTARAVSGLVYMFGLLREAHENLIPSILRVYRCKQPSERSKAERARAAKEFKINFARQFSTSNGASTQHVPIHFIGCWDTVESVGIWQFLGATITSDPAVKPGFHHLRHALALDELRWPFKPRPYTPPAGSSPDASRSFKQVWFRGAHSDIGGGYRESGLSNITLHWMVRESHAHGLHIDLKQLEARHITNPFDVMHDQIVAMPAWVLAGMFHRDFIGEMQIHESVYLRDSREPNCGQSIPRDATPAETLRTVEIYGTNGSQNEIEEREVPTVPSSPHVQPKKQSYPCWFLPTLVISGLATFTLLVVSRGAGFTLATHFQFGFKRGLFFQLGAALAKWQSEFFVNVAFLLFVDTLLIAVYSVFSTLLLVALLRWRSERKGYPSPTLGKLACILGLGLPISDLTENWLTFKALDAYLLRDTGAHWIAPSLLEGAYSLGTTFAATAKFCFLGLLIAIMFYCLMTGLFGCFSRDERMCSIDSGEPS
ncbi:hypothetical protein PROAA_910023 [Candidatus Propionivibrio aalborgensis]|uniref:T6SS Phospholipase effector Tle1-like catalytic domain-containing protein n=2 Tax=Candidatus Propionivibrio aalborgensis TaxID=1860101 RepID=A0A1A8Y2D7_9RHOO|nr:hypothetical protein PROAA_910023 [Candidatus Propionivibrio aalborgensis]